jgi:hypothetical protein
MQKSETSVQRTIVVDVDQQRAFTVFTEGINTWWPREHHIGEAPLDEVFIEPKEGGRWYSTHEDGSETKSGHVVSWEPPGRVVLAWQIGADWKYDPALVTEVEVTFIAETPDRTRVELEHRNLDRFGEAAEQMRDVFSSEGGWNGMMELYAKATAG